MNEKRMVIHSNEAARRLDVWLTGQLPELSRSQISKAFREKRILLNGKIVKAGTALVPGDTILFLPEESAPVGRPQAEDIPLHILYEDEDCLILNKERGLVVHPAPGHHGGTLVNGLLNYLGQDLDTGGESGRPGIVHRIDKDTSGLLLVVKNEKFHRQMAALIKEHKVERDYRALVWGLPPVRSGLIDAPLGRNPRHRQRYAVVAGGREARTHFNVLENFSQHSELELRLETGRTHQIRVHLLYIGHPIVGDPLYIPKRETFGMKGQALHAFRLRFTDPRDGLEKVFEAPLPADYLLLREKLSQL